MVKREKNIFKKILGTIFTVAIAIYFIFRTIPLIKSTFPKLTNIQILLGWLFLMLLIATVYFLSELHVNKKNYFKYTYDIFTSILQLILLPVSFILLFIINTIEGLFYIRYIKRIKESLEKKGKRLIIKSDKDVLLEELKHLLDKMFINPFKNKKGQVLALSLIILIIIITIYIIYLLIKGS